MLRQGYDVTAELCENPSSHRKSEKGYFVVCHITSTVLYTAISFMTLLLAVVKHLDGVYCKCVVMAACSFFLPFFLL